MVNPTSYAETWEKKDIHKFFVEFEFDVNGYQIQITKFSNVSFKTLKNHTAIPDQARTKSFSYMAYNSHKKHSIRYCSPHSKDYIKKTPWHNKYHRHEYDNGKEDILIYSKDDRPLKDRFNLFKSYNRNLSIQYKDSE